MNASEFMGAMISVDSTSSENQIFLRGNYSEKIMENIKGMFEYWGSVTFGDLIKSQDDKEFIISVRLQTE